jgi:hypothetical protein
MAVFTLALLGLLLFYSLLKLKRKNYVQSTNDSGGF